ncbi:hypothetical protein ACOQFV_27435 [Nocardiopsis changdeensis]|uniref:Uncharacterized protein n=1 Tax=Nocardiopsis changdeensis TaxID=2831969 RepID=A0ABX8BPL6_9ACTN|nr:MULTISPECIES: hypothetical protein [Nocardiopsis]QUX23002.1 hypothetical protein KGD84_00895 [Nocardiopsis changdeensis]QYX38945.1 hypothetical protein K1J57_10345 [Nocardiopsis sp. MT53]
MTTPKIDAKITAQVGDVLDPHMDTLMAKARAGQADELLIVGTLRPVERIEPMAGEDKEASLKLRLSSVEIPDVDQAEAVREVQRALWVTRTATGTLDEEGEIRIAKHTLRHAGRDVASLAAARLRAGVEQWQHEAHKATVAHLSASEMWHEMERISTGLLVLLGQRPDADEDGEQLALDE